MASGQVEFNKPVHELGHFDEPGPGEWVGVARRIVTLGRGASALAERITFELRAAGIPRDEPAHPDRVMDFSYPAIQLPRREPASNEAPEDQDPEDELDTVGA